MSSSYSARHGVLAALTVIAAAGLFLLGLAQGSAQAALVTTGSATFDVRSAKTGKVSAIAPAKVAKRNGKKGARVTSKVNSASLAAKTNVKVPGGLRFANGKRRIKATGLTVAITAKRSVVSGRLAGKKMQIFKAPGKVSLDFANGAVKVSAAKLAFTAKASKQVRKSLKLKKVPKGKLGAFSINIKQTDDTPVDPCVLDPNAEGCVEETPDPYFEQCGVGVVATQQGSLTPAPAAPEFTSTPNVTGPSAIAWGFKTSYRGYVVTAGGGSIHALEGAATTGNTPSFSGFEFPASGFRYTDNGTPNDMSDDKAVIEGTGTALFCAKGHVFRVALSNPTVVIDGENSRIDADVDANLSGTWVPTQRITVADLNVRGIVRQNGATGSKIKLDAVPASLTSEGTQAFCGVGELDKCSAIYPPGTPLDPISIVLDAEDQISVTDPYLAECGVAANGRVDGLWRSATPVPALEGALSTVAPTSIGWGFKSGFRSYVYGFMAGAGQGAKALQALDGAGRQPGGPTGGFTFPTAAGKYAINDPLDTGDDQAVINGTGTALICNSEHGFWAKVSNPTIVIDGEQSRIVADISSNETGVFAPSQRVNLADLDLTGITPFYNKSGSEVTWGSVPATLSDDAAPFATYGAGETLDPITVSLKTPYDTGAGDSLAMDALATYVSTNLPFPWIDSATGGCSLPTPAGGAPVSPETPAQAANRARTIDEAWAYGHTPAFVWTADGGRPAPLPDLSEAETKNSGGFEWGFRSGLRGSLNGNPVSDGGQFNLAGGATVVPEGTLYYGSGPGSTPRTGPGAGGMSGAGKAFRWPAGAGDVAFKANGAGRSDDQVIFKSEASVAFCQNSSNQWYGTVLANPTIVIDGANSRITMDIATRYRLSWVRGVVDVASLDASKVEFGTESVGGVEHFTWSYPGDAVTLTSDGSAALRMLSAQHIAGLALDPAKISIPVGS